jgi:replicative DNA helicase
VALSQLSRGVESRDNKRPQLSDLRESGSIEQDADIVMFLYREEYYLDKLLPPAEQRLAAAQADDKVAKMMEQLEKVRGKAELLISKNRKGPTGAIALSFQAETTTFHNYTDAPRYD